MCYLKRRSLVRIPFNQFSFLVGKSHSLKHIFAFDFSTELFYFGLYHYFFLFILFFIFYSFCNILFISFRQIQISENIVALSSDWLDSASESKDNWPLSFVDGNVDLPVLPLNTMDVTHAVFPLGCCYRLHAFAGQISDVSNSKVNVSHGNEIIGPCYELYNL